MTRFSPTSRTTGRLAARAFALSALAAVALGSPAQAQQSLDSFSLDGPADAAPAAPAAPAASGGEASALADCLLGEAARCAEGTSVSEGTSLDDLKEMNVLETVSPDAPRTRSIGLGKPRTRLAIVSRPKEEETAPLPSIDIEIPFAYDSDQPLPRAENDIVTLAQALRDKRFDDASFVLIGHTDAAGSASYNRALSERRAAAVQRRLADVSGLGIGRFVVTGRGEEDLKNLADPRAAENRRVQIVLVRGAQ